MTAPVNGSVAGPSGGPAVAPAGGLADDAVLVTGLGPIAPNGLGIEAFWAATLAGRHGIREISSFDPAGYPAVLAGQIDGFEAAEYLPNRLLPQTDVSTRYALAAASLALADAALDPATQPDYSMGVITSNATGGFEFTHREFQKLWTQGPEAVSVYESFAWFYAVNTGQISIRHGLRGPGAALVADQAGGLQALGHARRTVRSGTALVVTGGVDSALDPWGWASQLSSGLVSRSSDPERAYLPFDRRGAGHVPGEGGAIVILESAASARARGVLGYGEIIGQATTFDPRPGSGRPPALRRTAELALADAGIGSDEVDVVFADAAGSAELDAVEAAAIGSVFGPRGVPVAAPKSLVGRLYSGGGPLDLVCALLAIRDGVVPPAAAATLPAQEYALDLVTGVPRPLPVRTALILARGRWGFNAALVVRAVAGQPPRRPIAPATSAAAS